MNVVWRLMRFVLKRRRNIEYFFAIVNGGYYDLPGNYDLLSKTLNTCYMLIRMSDN